MTNPEQAQQKAVPQNTSYEKMEKDGQQKIYDLRQDLVAVKRYYELRAATDPEAQKKLEHVEAILAKFQALIEGKAQLCVDKLGPYMQYWDERAEVIRSTDPMVRDFKELTEQKQYDPPMTDSIGENYEYVEWGVVLMKSTDASQDLVTQSMGPCSSLAVVNDKTGSQTLAHIYPTDRGTLDFGNDWYMLKSDMHKVIRKLVQDLTKAGPDARYYVVEGGSQDKDSAFRVYSCLRGAGISQDRIQYVPSRPNRRGVGIIHYGENVIIQKGKLLRASDALNVNVAIAHDREYIKETCGEELLGAFDRVFPVIWKEQWPTLMEGYRESVAFGIKYGNQYPYDTFISASDKMKNIEKEMLRHPDVQRISVDDEKKKYAAVRFMDGMKHMMKMDPERYFPSPEKKK